MPYKDLQKRREAYRQWYKKNKAKRSAYYKILYIAKKANPIREICSVEGCTELGERHHPDYTHPDVIIWVCKKHHQRVYHRTKCSICGEDAVARGYCNKHYKSEMRKNDPSFRLKEKEFQRRYWRRKHPHYLH